MYTYTLHVHDIVAVPGYEYNLTGEDEDDYIKDIRRELAKWDGRDGSILCKYEQLRAAMPRHLSWHLPGDYTSWLNHE
jgi:hypothetical protein